MDTTGLFECQYVVADVTESKFQTRDLYFWYCVVWCYAFVARYLIRFPFNIYHKSTAEISNIPNIVLLIGELNQTRETMRLLLTKIAEDPLSSSCPNISYVDVTGPVASAYPTGSPYALFSAPPTGPPHHPNAATALSPCSPTGRCFIHPPPPPQQTQSHHHGGGAGGHLSSPTAPNGRLDSMGRRMMNGRGAGGPQSLLGAAAIPTHAGGGGGGGGGGANLWSSSPSSPPFPISLDVVRSLLHSTGYTEDAMEEITHAMRVLHAYGLLSLTNLASWVSFGSTGGGGNGAGSRVPMNPMAQGVQEVTSQFGSAGFAASTVASQQQQQPGNQQASSSGQAVAQQQTPSGASDPLYRPQDNGGGGGSNAPPGGSTDTASGSR